MRLVSSVEMRIAICTFFYVQLTTTITCQRNNIVKVIFTSSPVESGLVLIRALQTPYTYPGVHNVHAASGAKNIYLSFDRSVCTVVDRSHDGGRHSTFSP